jgi:ribosomal protein S18 acetylase RimI-like enzyme
VTIGLITRPATIADVPALVALVNSAYRGDSSRAGWTSEADLLDGQRVDDDGLTETIAGAGDVILLHERDLVPVGCVHLERTGEDCHLGMLTIQPATQGAGLGRQMLQAAERWAMEHWSSQTMQMMVIVQRTELIAWYERRGYRRTGERRPFPYGDERFGLPRRDDLAFEVLRKPLSQSSEGEE